MKTTLVLIALFFFCAASNATAVDNHVRNIFSPLVSAVDSLLGISTADDSTPTSTIVQTPVSTEARTTVAADPVSTAAPSETQAPAASTVLQTPPSTEVQTSPTAAPPPPPTQPSSIQPSPTEETTIIGASLATLVSTSSSSISTAHRTTSSLSTPINPLASITSTVGTHTTSADPMSGFASSTPAPSPSSTSSGGNVSKGGLAVAIIAALLLVAGIVYLFIRFNPAIQAKYAVWRESRMDQADEENVVAHLEKAEDYEKPVFGKAVVVNIANNKPSGRRNSQESEQTLVPAKSPCDSCHKQRKPRFSFQFFNPPSPSPLQTEKPVRRKPVPTPLNLTPTVGPADPSIGVALGTPSKRTLPYPLSPKSWMGGRKRVSYFEDYSNVGRR